MCETAVISLRCEYKHTEIENITQMFFFNVASK